MIEIDENIHHRMKVRCAKLNVRISDYFSDLLKKDLKDDIRLILEKDLNDDIRCKEQRVIGNPKKQNGVENNG